MCETRIRRRTRTPNTLGRVCPPAHELAEPAQVDPRGSAGIPRRARRPVAAVHFQPPVPSLQPLTRHRHRPLPAARSQRRRVCEAAHETDAHESLQPAADVARQLAPAIGRGGRGRLWVAGGFDG